MTLAFSQTRDQGEDSGASLPKPLTLPGTHPGYVGLPERSLPAHHFHSPDLGSGFPGGSAGKESACDVGDLGSIPGLGRSPGEGHGNPLQDSCLQNSMDRGVLRATVHGVADHQTQLSD